MQFLKVFISNNNYGHKIRFKYISINLCKFLIVKSPAHKCAPPQSANPVYITKLAMLAPIACKEETIKE